MPAHAACTRVAAREIQGDYREKWGDIGRCLHARRRRRLRRLYLVGVSVKLGLGLELG